MHMHLARGLPGQNLQITTIIMEPPRGNLNDKYGLRYQYGSELSHYTYQYPVVRGGSVQKYREYRRSAGGKGGKVLTLMGILIETFKIIDTISQPMSIITSCTRAERHCAIIAMSCAHA